MDMKGFCWPLSAAPGETLRFFTSTTSPSFTVFYVRFRNQHPDSVTDDVIGRGGEIIEVPITRAVVKTGRRQNSSHSAAEGANDWDISFSLTIVGLRSGIYAAKCVDQDGSTFYVPFVVKPALDRRNRFMAIANTNTWNAYNAEFEKSRYWEEETAPGVFKLSFLRPHHSLFNLTRLDESLNPHGGFYGFSSKHLLRGELWVLNWLEQSGFRVDVFTDLDLHRGIEEMSDYQAMILSTHPEYWSVEMYRHLADYLDGGGTLFYLGGNGIFDSVTYSRDLKVMTAYGRWHSRTHLLSQLGLPEARLLGVATPLKRGFEKGTTLQADGNNFPERVPYAVLEVSRGERLHPVLARAGIRPKQKLGKRGWHLSTGQQLSPKEPPSIANSGASGGECDRRDKHSPSGTALLAVGQNVGPLAEMTYYQHAGGGFVLSMGSISFGGSLVLDPALQQILINAFRVT